MRPAAMRLRTASILSCKFICASSDAVLFTKLLVASIDEKLRNPGLARDQSLHVRIPDGGREVFAIDGTQAVNPAMTAYNGALRFPSGADPRQRNYARIAHTRVSRAFGFFKSRIQAGRHPRMTIQNRLANHGDMHNREYPG